MIKQYDFLWSSFFLILEFKICMSRKAGSGFFSLGSNTFLAILHDEHFKVGIYNR